MNVSQAGRAAGYGTPQAAHHAFNSIRRAIPDILDRLDCGVEKSLKLLAEMCHATKFEFAQKDGKLTEQREVPDNERRFLARRELLRLHNAYPSRSARGEPHESPVVFHVSLSDEKRAQKIAAALSANEWSRDKASVRVSASLHASQEGSVDSSSESSASTESGK